MAKKFENLLSDYLPKGTNWGIVTSKASHAKAHSDHMPTSSARVPKSESKPATCKENMPTKAALPPNKEACPILKCHSIENYPQKPCEYCGKLSCKEDISSKTTIIPENLPKNNT